MSIYRSNESYLMDLVDQKSVFFQGGKGLGEVLSKSNEAVKNTLKAGVFLPLEYLLLTFELSPFERFCVKLCFIAELTPQEDAVTPHKAMALFSEEKDTLAYIDCFHNNSTLMTYFLEISEEHNKRLFSPLGLKDRILSFALGKNSLDPELLQVAELWYSYEPLEEQYVLKETTLDMANNMKEFFEKNEKTVFFLEGQRGAGRLDVAKNFCVSENAPLIIVDIKKVIKSKSSYLSRIFTELAIHGAGICYINFEELLEENEEEYGEEAKFLIDQTLAVTDLVFCSSTKHWYPYDKTVTYGFFPIIFTMPTELERVHLWEEAIIEGSYTLDEGVTISDFANKFVFTKGQIEEAIFEASGKSLAKGNNAIDIQSLYDGCYSKIPSFGKSNRLVKVNTHYSWDDLILPSYSKDLLKIACNRVNHGHIVYNMWGFEKKLPYGKGVSMIFVGPPGTGKTMGAQVIAGTLHLELYKVDLAGVVSKYIGETEKNLEKVFEQGKRSQAVLFFDEADVLFSKRTEVKDSNDKYSNMEAAFMLQKIEEYEGTCILATNFIQNFDEAFKRRMKFVIEFPFPDYQYRKLLWDKAFPEKTPLDSNIDLEFLAKSFELSGSNIKNIAVNAAFEAAVTSGIVGMPEIIKALKIEYAKSGKIITKQELGQYFSMF